MATVHVISIHWKSPKWLELQLEFLNRSFGRNCIVHWGVSADIEEQAKRILGKDRGTISAVNGRHSANLDQIASSKLPSAREDDVVLFLDGDALTLCKSDDLHREVQTHGLVAARRLENSADSQPHPLFAAASAEKWKAQQLTWGEGPTRLVGSTRSDVGGLLLRQLAESNQLWKPLDRSNRVNPHPLWFAIYGSHVYHHGAAFRAPWSSQDRVELYGNTAWRRRIGRLDEYASKVPMLRARTLRGRREDENRRVMQTIESEFWADPTRFIDCLR